jgi:hypothetical protein
MPSKRVIAFQQFQQQREQEARAQVEGLIAEFNGESDAAGALTRMGEEILYWRHRMGLIADVVAKIQHEEPFAILGAGRYWEPGKRKPGWWR